MSAPAPALAARPIELRFPPLPHTLIEAMDLLAHPERMEVRDVTAMVERDPVVVARLLSRVNAAYTGVRRAVTSPEQAVVMLGPVTVVNLVAGLGMLKMRPATQGPAGACFARLIAHSLATADLTRYLVDLAPHAHTGATPPKSGVAFTVGLLHDFGKLVLAYNFPNHAATLYGGLRLPPTVPPLTQQQRERQVFGHDHTDIGGLAATRLQFGGVLTDVVRFHHRAEALAGHGGVPPVTARLLRGVAGASLAASAMGHGTGPAVPWEAVAQAPIWRLLVAHDLPAFGSPQALLARVQALQTGVGDFVRAITDVPAAAGPADSFFR